MIKCRDDSLLPIDQRVIDYIVTSAAFGLHLDSDYLAALPDIHGGVPVAPYFTTPSGETREVAWFVSFLDTHSDLPGLFESAFYYQQNDTRIDDRSIPGILNDEVCPYHGGERIFPFAALVTHGNSPLTLRLYTLDSFPGDSLCFDVSTTPHSVVICNGREASKEVVRWDEGEIDELNYEDFTERVADSFSDFAKMLRAER